MVAESRVQVTISLEDSDLDLEQVNHLTQNLKEQIEYLDEVEAIEPVEDTEKLEGEKAIGGFLVGVLQALVNPENIAKVLEFLGDRILALLGDRLQGRTAAIELELKANDKEIKVKVRREEDLPAAIQAIQIFLTLP